MFPKDFMTYEESVNIRNTFSIRFFTASTDNFWGMCWATDSKNFLKDPFQTMIKRVETDMGPFGINF